MNRRLPDAVRALPEAVRASAAIETLTPRERSVLALMLIEGLSPVEVAGALGTSARQIERLYSAALGSVSREMHGVRRAA